MQTQCIARLILEVGWSCDSQTLEAAFIPVCAELAWRLPVGETIREGIEISREALLGFCCRLARTRRPNRSQVGSGQNIRVESLSRRGLRGPVADRGPNWQLGSCPGHGSSVYPDVSGPAERLALLVVQSLQT